MVWILGDINGQDCPYHWEAIIKTWSGVTDYNVIFDYFTATVSYCLLGSNFSACKLNVMLVFFWPGVLGKTHPHTWVAFAKKQDRLIKTGVRHQIILFWKERWGKWTMSVSLVLLQTYFMGVQFRLLLNQIPIGSTNFTVKSVGLAWGPARKTGFIQVDSVLRV